MSTRLVCEVTTAKETPQQRIARLEALWPGLEWHQLYTDVFTTDEISVPGEGGENYKIEASFSDYDWEEDVETELKVTFRLLYRDSNTQSWMSCVYLGGEPAELQEAISALSQGPKIVAGLRQALADFSVQQSDDWDSNDSGYFLMETPEDDPDFHTRRHVRIAVGRIRQDFQKPKWLWTIVVTVGFHKMALSERFEATNGLPGKIKRDLLKVLMKMQMGED